MHIKKKKKPKGVYKHNQSIHFEKMLSPMMDTMLKIRAQLHAQTVLLWWLSETLSFLDRGQGYGRFLSVIFMSGNAPSTIDFSFH